MTAHIIYQNYLNRNGDGMSLGGIQTYITELSKVLIGLGYDVNIYQESDIPFEKYIGPTQTVIGCNTKGLKFRSSKQKLFKLCLEKFNRDNDLLIFGCESMLVHTEGIPAIAVQHGISWDKPENKKLKPAKYLYKYILKSYRAWGIVRRVELAKYLVCVDYNFINWYRALVAYPNINLKAVPNFSAIAPRYDKFVDENETINIVFARRFFRYRGTRIFNSAIKRILAEFKNVKVTIAGEGLDEKLLKDSLSSDSRVSFTTYGSEESLDFHKDKHIAVVPTTGSEGTSLSLLEAMSSQCAVICTNVGGMTNIVIDGYNGLMISPDADELYEALKKLLLDRNLCHSLSEKAYETVNRSFSREKWGERWSSIITDFQKNK